MGSLKKEHDATRQERKAKKRKLEDAVPDLPGDNDRLGEDTAIAGQVDAISGKKRKWGVDAEGERGGANDEEKERKGRKKEKKRRRKETEEDGRVAIEVEKVGKKEMTDKKKKDKESATVEPEVEIEADADEEQGPKKSKKERKADRRSKASAKAAAKSKAAAPVEESKAKTEAKTSGHVPAAIASVEEEKKSKKNNRNREKKRKGAVTSAEGAAVNGDGEKAEEKDKKDARFICFIGNLPFTANTESITKHFTAVKPISVRALTQKDNPSKSKGIAFVEFEGYDHMKTCLKLFHHSMFDDGLSPARKINVELTAGGGGNTKDRRAKIQEKNQKLNEQRVRRMQEEEKAKLEKSSNAAAIDESAIHPSRRTRVPSA